METPAKAESGPDSDSKARRLTFDELKARIASPEAEQARQSREADEAKRALLRERVERQRALAVLERQAGARYAGCTIGNFQATSMAQQKVIRAMREFAGNLFENFADGTSVVFYGPVGTGKDHLAFSLARSLLEQQSKSVLWINGQTWFGQLRDNMDREKSEASAVAQLATPWLLVISDPLPPAGALTQYQSTMLYRVIDARYSRGLATICTVNVRDDAEADERLGAATWDRLCHGAWKLHCNWESYRKPARTV